MDPIRKRLMELRDEWADERENFSIEPTDDFEDGVSRTLDDCIEGIDRILADWSEADEIRPREPTEAMIEAGSEASGDWDNCTRDSWIAQFDAYKQEQALDNLTAQAQEHNMGYDD